MLQFQGCKALTKYHRTSGNIAMSTATEVALRYFAFLEPESN